jgi:hypothetical protein
VSAWTIKRFILARVVVAAVVDTWTSVDKLREVLAPHWEEPREHREQRGPAGTKYNTCPVKVRKFHEDLRDAGWYDAGPDARARYVRAAKALSYDLGDEDGRKIFEEVVCWRGERQDEGMPTSADGLSKATRPPSDPRPVRTTGVHGIAHRFPCCSLSVPV